MDILPKGRRDWSHLSFLARSKSSVILDGSHHIHVHYNLWNSLESRLSWEAQFIGANVRIIKLSEFIELVKAVGISQDS